MRFVTFNLMFLAGDDGPAGQGAAGLHEVCNLLQPGATRRLPVPEPPSHSAQGTDSIGVLNSCSCCSSAPYRRGMPLWLDDRVYRIA